MDFLKVLLQQPEEREKRREKLSLSLSHSSTTTNNFLPSSPSSPPISLNHPVEVVHGVHVARRVGGEPRPHYPRRHPHGDAVRRQVGDDDRPGPDLAPGPDRHGPQNAHAGPEEGAVADVRVPRAPPRSRTAQGDVVEQRNAVADDGGLPDDDARGVVDHHPPADAGSRVDVDVEDLGDAGLDGQGEGAAA